MTTQLAPGVGAGEGPGGVGGACTEPQDCFLSATLGRRLPARWMLHVDFLRRPPLWKVNAPHTFERLWQALQQSSTVPPRVTASGLGSL